jgi:hypothetical protein
MHFFWGAVWLVIPLAGTSAGVLRHWFRVKERQLELLTDQTAEKAAQYAAKTERLEQRVAVLERILTDRSYALGEEIESLRTRPIN